MRKAFRPAALGLAGLFIAVSVPALTPAFADVKAGVDAWSRGDYRKAVEEWRPAAIAGDADAQFNLGQAYKLGRGVPVDMAMAESWYRKAALQGQVEAEANYGLILFQNGKREDALPWLNKAVARGEPRAQLVLGTMLYNGDGVMRDWPRAYALIVRSAASGSPRASEVQAQMDQYIPADDRQKGLLLARQYEAEAQRAQLPPEIAGQGTQNWMRGTDLPPSSYDQNGGAQPGVDAPRPEKPKPIIAASIEITQSLICPVLTSIWVLTEVADALSDPAIRSRTHRFLKSVASHPKSTVISEVEPWYSHGLALYGARADKSWSLTDCISFAIMSDRGISDALTGDRHFILAGFQALLAAPAA